MNLFIHHRDLRITDNTTLLKMCREFKGDVQPIFIFPPTQIDKDKNRYFSNQLVEFMCRSLLELKKEYQKRLLFFYGEPIKVLESILDKGQTISSMGWNKDYSPYARQRDKEIKGWAKKKQIKIFEEEDMLLVPIEKKHNKTASTGEPYKVFTYFKNHIRSFIEGNVDTFLPDITPKDKLESNLLIDKKRVKKFYQKNKNPHVYPGREAALKTLHKLNNLTSYGETRNTLSLETSNMSAYINLGLVSIREMLKKGREVFGNHSSWETELIWRDFYYNILYYFPHVVGGSFRKEYDNISWNKNPKGFKKWCEGTTGFPIVDAAMRQLNQTGYMHNRGRMIVASFLTKDLGIDWREGERYFAQKLIDYNISANNGGWQWSSGSGTDAQPYFRIFNPWSQNKSYDKDCVYVKRWIPELANVPTKDILNWDKKHTKHPDVDYPPPMLDHSDARKKTLEMYKNNL